MSGTLTDAEMASGSTEKPPTGSIPLNNFSHELYARERALGQPITHAAQRAGLGKRTGAGSKIEAAEDVRARIAWLAREDDEIVREKRRRLEERQWLIHDCDIATFFEDVEEVENDDNGNPKLDPDGNRIIRKRQRLKHFSEIPAELRMCIEGLTYTEKGRPNLKVYSKQDASRELRKLLGLDAPTKSELTGADGGPIIQTITRTIVKPGYTDGGGVPPAS